MQVETFECQETAAEPIEASEEAVRLIEEMGLTGQRALVGKSKTGDRDVRGPYREMTDEERFTYGVLCPEVVSLEKYSRSPIPLRVLQIAAHAKSLGLFNRIKVWDRESVAEKDPVLVAETGQYEWSPEKVFILARWGEELETFSVLLKRATDILRQQAKQNLEAALAAVGTCSIKQLRKIATQADGMQ